MATRKNSGLFITFEGGEGVGKTTLIESVYQNLISDGHSVFKTREPGGTKLGQLVREILLHHDGFPVSKKSELLLFLADRAQHVEEVILPNLEKYDFVLCDRFNDSTLAYQGAARSIDPELLQTLCGFAAAGLTPDITLFLDLDPIVGLQRKKGGEKHDRIEREEIDFHNKVHQAFLSFAKNEPERFHVIDASQDSHEVFKQAMEMIAPCIN